MGKTHAVTPGTPSKDLTEGQKGKGDAGKKGVDQINKKKDPGDLSPGTIGTFPPWFYDSPDLDDKSPHPDVTDRATESHGTREVLLNGVDGRRAWGMGKQRVAGKLQYVFKEPRAMPNDVWLVIELGKGEADALIKCTRDGVDVTTLPGIAFWWYPGTPAGTVDSHLLAVDATWNEAFPGTIHAVVHLWDLDKNWPQTPNLLWEMRMYKPIDPRTDARAYSENPFVQAWDFCLDAEGKHMPTARLIKQWFIDAANIADEMVGSPAHKRYETHPLLMDGVDTDDVIKMFRLMTDSFWFPDAGKFGFLCDRPGSPVASYGDSALSRSFKPQYSREDQQERPTKVIVEFTDVTNDWKTKTVEAVPPGTPVGTEDDAPVTYRMPWIHDEGIAQSRALYIASGFTYDGRVRVPWNATTEARKLGDIVTQALNARGLSFTGRLISRSKPTRKSVYTAILREYNAARYADYSVAATAKTPSTLPAPSDVPPDVDLATVTITELLYAEQPGFGKTYGLVQITNPSFYFLDAVELWFSKSGGDYRFYDVFPAGSGNVVKLHFDAIAELGVPYSFKFITRSQYGPKSAGAVKTPATTFVGKTAPPSDVPLLYSQQIGADVKVQWQRGTDTDILGYEIRRGTTADTWATAALVHQVGASTLYYVDKPPNSGGLPGGVWRYFIKAINGAKLYSTNAKTDDIAVFNIGPALAETTATYGIHGASTNTDMVWELGNALFEGWLTQKTVRALLCRRLSPTTSDSELHTAGYTSIQQWETNIDAPRRNGQALWAPLDNQNESGTFTPYSGSGGSFLRNKEVRSRVTNTVRVGLDTPDIVTRCEPILISGPGGYIVGPTIRSGPGGPASYFVHGLKLSSNSKYAQTMMIGTAGTTFFYDTIETVVVPIDEVDVVTDGSGNASYTLAVAKQLGAGCTLSVTPKILGTNSAVGWKLASVDNTSFTVKVVDGTGAAVAGITVRCTIEDKGIGGTANFFIA